MEWMRHCLYCQAKVYHLSDGYIKCASCRKKLSKNRINKVYMLLDGFASNESAHALSKRTGIAYATIHSYYNEFRLLCAALSEEEYEALRERACEFEEYYYLEHAKKYDKAAVFDAHNFLTFDYGGHIYTLPLPSLQQYKQKFLHDGVEDAYIEEFKKFKRASRLIRIEKNYNNIVEFWRYFEDSIVLYKGIKPELFAYFLKEFEFKYNHTKEEVIDLLAKNYFKGKR